MADLVIDSHVHFSRYGHDVLSFAQVRDSLLLAGSLPIPPSALELVLGGNAARLFRLEET